MAELDELKDIVKKHWLFILGRPNGQRAILWLRGQPIAQRLIDPRLPAVAEFDELKDIVKRH